MCRNKIVTAATVCCFLFCRPSSALAQHHGGAHEQGAVVLDSVTVTADKIEAYVENHPQQAIVVKREEILERNFLNVEETLNSMPGVEVRPSAGIGSRISIWGSGGTGGVLVLLNGRPLNSSQYGSVDFSTIPIEIVKSVTVFKPPAPVWLGTGASQGVISIFTHDFRAESQEDEEGGKKKGATRIKLSGGSYGLAEGSLSHNAPLTNGSVMVTASGSHKDGKRTNNDKNKGVFSSHWDFTTENALQYDINGRYYAAEYGAPGPTDNPTPDARQRYEKSSLDFQARGFVGENGDYSLKAYADQVSLTDETQFGLTSDLDDLKLGTKLDATWSEEEGVWTLRIGGILQRGDVEHTITGDHHRVTAGLHVQYDRHFGPAVATLGIRGDHTSDFGYDPGCSGGVSYALIENSLIKANAGYTVKAPTFGQLYQPAHGSYDQVRGNPDLEEEKIWSYDLGVEYRFRKDRIIQAALFRTDTRDLIVYMRDDDLIYYPVNTSRAWRQGVELSCKYAWHDRLAVDVSYILQNSENNETGNELAYTPRHKFKTTLKWTLTKMETRLESALRYEADRYSEAEGQKSMKLDDFITIDLKLIQPFKINDKPLEFFINIYNVFDADYEIHYGYPDDGVRFVAGVNITL